MSGGAALAQAALALVGCRYRLHGRDPATGLDCVGVLAVALALIGRSQALPGGYPLRTSAVPDLAGLARDHGFVPVPPGTGIAPGEVWLLRPGPGQWHLALVAPDGASLIEAHAGLRRVVRVPLPAADPGDSAPAPARWRLAD
ncbi:hypothetical protein [Novosphingobium sp.]|uniref:hypothetical protein n=1 Tax=Novosphingobium sp. TaxID=1874826 RepID=UPI00260F751D|nr:hypothetical protein [Novosphingobium sp.]